MAYTKVDFAGESDIACRSMVGDGEEFVPAHDVLCAMDFTAADSFKYISKDGELLAQFTKALTQLGVDNVDAYFAKIAAVFDLSLAGDCHLQNFGFIRDLNTMRLRVAPLFDRGRSFGSFGKPLENGRFSCAEYAIGSARTMFVMMLFHSILIRSDWDFGWYDPARLEGFEDEMDSMLAVCADIPKEYIEILKEAFRYQLDYLSKAAEKA